VKLAHVVGASDPGLLLENSGKAVATVRVARTNHKNVSWDGLKGGTIYIHFQYTTETTATLFPQVGVLASTTKLGRCSYLPINGTVHDDFLEDSQTGRCVHFIQEDLKGVG
jgi:hypothetical protein